MHVIVITLEYMYKMIRIGGVCYDCNKFPWPNPFSIVVLLYVYTGILDLFPKNNPGFSIDSYKTYSLFKICVFFCNFTLSFNPLAYFARWNLKNVAVKCIQTTIKENITLRECKSTHWKQKYETDPICETRKWKKSLYSCEFFANLFLKVWDAWCSSGLEICTIPREAWLFYSPIAVISLKFGFCIIYLENISGNYIDSPSVSIEWFYSTFFLTNVEICFFLQIKKRMQWFKSFFIGFSALDIYLRHVR